MKVYQNGTTKATTSKRGPSGARQREDSKERKTEDPKREEGGPEVSKEGSSRNGGPKSPQTPSQSLQDRPGREIEHRKGGSKGVEVPKHSKGVSRTTNGSIVGFRGDGQPWCLLERFLQVGQVNMVIGPTRMGKSILLDNLIAKWSVGEPMFDRASYPMSWWYVSLGKNSLKLGNMKFVSGSGRYTGSEKVPVEDDGRIYINSVVERVNAMAEALFTTNRERWELGGGDPDRYESPRVLFIDELCYLADGDLNKDADARRFMRMLEKACEKHGITIVGSSLTGKLRRNDRPVLVAESGKGSTETPSCYADLIVMEMENPDDARCAARKLTLHSHFSAPDLWGMEFAGQDEEGWPAVEFSVYTRNNEEKLDERLAGRAPGAMVEFKDVQKWAEEENVSRSTAARWIGRKVNEGRLKRGKRGCYTIKRSHKHRG